MCAGNVACRDIQATSERKGFATRIMMLDYLTSYVPAITLRRLRAAPFHPVGPVTETVSAAVLFADISGFTALAERLAQRGPIGAEELTRSLNMVFDLLIDVIDSQGGEVVKFAGDALLALWPITAHTLSDAVCLAARAALVMHTRLAALQRLILQNPLTLKIGIGAGDVSIAAIGGIRGRWDTLVFGETVTQVSIAEGDSLPGHVVLSPEAWGLVSDRCRGQELPAGGARVLSVYTPVSATPAGRLELTEDLADSLRAFIPGAVLAQPPTDESRWIGDLRRISVLFIGLPELGDDLERQHAIMGAAQTALYRFEGSINKLSVDEKGVTLVAALGLPPLAHEDDAARALRAALAIQRSVEELGGTCTIGIASGRVFCGAVGNDLRREYTMIGDVVNLAARLMQAAGLISNERGSSEAQFPTGVICDEATAHAAREQIDVEPLEPIQVKGKSQPVSVFRPVLKMATTARTSRPQVEVIGRVEERELIYAALDQVVTAGQSQTIVIEGDAGMGKSWLIADLVREASARRINVFLSGGDALEELTPYYAWRNIFSQLYDIDVLSDSAARRRHMLDLLELEPELLDWAPLLNTVLPLDLPDNEYTENLSDALRADQTRQMLVGCISASTARSPKVIILDDMHWSDSASWVLAEQIAQHVPRLLLIIAARPTAVAPAGMRAARAIADSHLVLDSLSRTDLIQLISSRLGASEIPEPIIELIWERAQGNPFFSAELAYALRDSGLLQIEGDRCIIAAGTEGLRALSLPDTLQGVITSRIDRLTPAQQLTLKTASVIGFVFAERVLHAIYPIEHERTLLDESLQALEQHDMTLPEPLELESAYRFKHAITQEVVYDLMLFSQRRTLHRSLATWYEHMYADDLERYFQLLGHHWSRAGDIHRALDYFDRAARQSMALCAYREAGNLLAQALTLVEEIEPPEPERHIRLLYDLGQVCWMQGDPIAARGYFQHALVRARHLRDEGQIARILSRMARVDQDLRQFAAAEKALRESLEIATRTSDHEAMIGIARNLGNAALLRGDLDQAQEHWAESLNLARRANDILGIARALGNQGWGHYLQQRYAEARVTLREALIAAEPVGDQWVVADIMTSLGLTICDDSQYNDIHEAQSLLTIALQIGLRVGVLARTLFTLAALARWREVTGQPEAALELAAFVRKQAVGGNDTQIIVDGVCERLRADFLPEQFAAIIERGEQLTMDAVIQGLPRE